MLVGAEVEQHLRAEAGAHSSVAVADQTADQVGRLVGNTERTLAPAIS